MSETPDTPDATPHTRVGAAPTGAAPRTSRPVTPRRAAPAGGAQARARAPRTAEDGATQDQRDAERRERAERRAREAAARHARQDREAQDSATPQRRVIRLALPDGWARSLFAGVEAAFIGWGLVMVVVLVGYLAVSSNAWLAKATWGDAMGVAGDAWAATLGADVGVGATAYWAVPTGLTLVVILALRVLLISGRQFPATAQWMAVPGFAVSSLILAGATAGHTTVWHALPGALALPVLACAWAAASQTTTWPQWCARVGWIWDGLRQARAAVIGALSAGAVATAASLWVHWSDVRAVHSLLLPASTTDSVVIVAAQVFFAPTVVLWALSWLAGPGFWVGAGTLHAPGWAPTAPIPAIPLLGALPTTAPGNWVAWYLVGVGILVGAFLRWRHRAERVREQALAGVVAVVATAAIVAALLLGSRMHLGSGRMALLGPRVAWTAALVALEVAGVGVVVALAAHPHTLGWLRKLRVAWSGDMPAEETDARGNAIVAASAVARAGHAWSQATSAVAGRVREVSRRSGVDAADEGGAAPGAADTEGSETTADRGGDASPASTPPQADGDAPLVGADHAPEGAALVDDGRGTTGEAATERLTVAPAPTGAGGGNDVEDAPAPPDASDPTDPDEDLNSKEIP